MSSLKLTRNQVLLLVALFVATCVMLAITFYLANDERVQAEPTVADKVFSIGSSQGSHVYENLDGQPIGLEEYESKTVVITTWASWCPACQTTLVEANEIARVLKQNGIDVLAINRMENQVIANAFLKTLPPLEHLNVIIDTEDQVFTETDGFTVPETTVFNPDGEVVYQEHYTFSKSSILDAALNVD